MEIISVVITVLVLLWSYGSVVFMSVNIHENSSFDSSSWENHANSYCSSLLPLALIVLSALDTFTNTYCMDAAKIAFPEYSFSRKKIGKF